MKSFFKKQNKNGFSIIEVIVAVGIITIGIIPIITLFNQNLESEIKNKNTLIAVYLASESIEIVRQQRDNNWFAGDDWMKDIPTGDVIVGLLNSEDIRRGWNIKTLVVGVGKEKVYLDPNNSFSYVQSNGEPLGHWTETPFERYLTINKGADVVEECLGEEDCIQITSYVSFNGTAIAEVTTYLYDWKN